MLKRITIKGFKSIVDEKIEFGRLNLFIGANGAGKSVVLEAIGVLGAAADGRVDDASLLRRGVRPGVPALYKNAFAQHDIPRVITFNARSNHPLAGIYDVSLDNPIGRGGTPWRFTHEKVAFGERKYVTRGPRGATLWGTRGRKQFFTPPEPTRGVSDTPSPFGRLPDAISELLQALRTYAIFDPQTPVLRGIEPESTPIDPLGIRGSKLAEALMDLDKDDGRIGTVGPEELGELIGWAKNVGSAAPTPELISPSLPASKLIVRFTDRFMRTDRNLLSAYDASEGALYVLFALALLFHPRSPKIFAIENIDHALHPRLARRLVRSMTEHVKQSGKQALLTTHNPLVLDALDLSDDDIRLFTVDRDRFGRTKIRRLPFTDALAKAQKEGLTLSQMWTQGLIGAVPNIL